MINRFIRIVLLTIVSAALATGAFADPIPEGARGENIEAVAFFYFCIGPTFGGLKRN